MKNVELISEFWRVWSEEGLTGVLSRYDDFFTDDFEWRPPITEVTGARYVGREGFERYIADVEETLSDTRGEVEEVVEVAPDVVRSRVRMHGQGSASGAAIDAPVAGVSLLRNGRVCWAWGSYDLAAAEKIADSFARGEEVEV